MSEETENTPVFVIGLTMAGAISAGAYTAGVVDYLMRAMQAHNARVGKVGGPKHKVMIKAISGASAGGMCAGLIAANLIAVGADGEPDWGNPQPISYTGDDGETKGGFLVLERIYKAWVSEVKMWDAKTLTGLLSCSDLDTKSVTLDQKIAQHAVGEPDCGNTAPISVLNGQFLDDVAGAALENIPAWSDSHAGYDFISSELDLFLTTSALSGTVYNIDFSGGNPFSMEEHAIARHFLLKGVGSGPAMSSPWLEKWHDKGIVLDPRQAPNPLPMTDETGGAWSKLTVACLATGAFPIGLAPRIISSTPRELGLVPDADSTKPNSDTYWAYGGALPFDFPGERTVRPDFGSYGLDANTPYIAVDGGMINNEPFGYARYTIQPKPPKPADVGKPDLQNAADADRAVLMVDPFPEGASYAVTAGCKLIKSLPLLPVIKKLLPALIGQARFKPAELAEAHNPDIATRFLISPVRNDETHRLKGAQAIACGLLGGFGGFLDEKFREHDFVLGQRNCQYFLKNYFCLNPSNPVLRGVGHATGIGGKVPVIDPGALAEMKIPLHAWSAMSCTDLKAMLAQLNQRVKRLVKASISDLPGLPSSVIWVLKRVWSNLPFVNLYKPVMRIVTGLVLEDMILRNQVQCFADAAYSPADRLLLAGLALSPNDSVSAAALLEKVKTAMANGELPDRLYPEDPVISLPDAVGVESFLKGQKRRGFVRQSSWNPFSTNSWKLDIDGILNS